MLNKKALAHVAKFWAFVSVCAGFLGVIYLLTLYGYGLLSAFVFMAGVFSGFSYMVYKDHS